MVLSSFLIVPLAVGYLGSERYGAWVTISSTLGWLYVADAGLGNALTNLFTEAWSQGKVELSRHHIATAFWLLACVAATCAIVFALLWSHIGWAAILNVQSAIARLEVPRVVALSVAVFLVGFPLTVVDRIYAACQEGAIGNSWSSAGAVASFCVAVVATRTQAGMVGLTLAVLGAPLALQLVSSFWLFAIHRPSLRPAPSAVRRASLGHLSRAGALFFLIQIAALILFNTDNFIIAHVLGAAQVTPYSVSWKLFTLPSMALALAFPYLCPAYVEAFARGDRVWIRRTFRLSVLISLSMAIAIAVPLVVFGRPLIAAWAGKQATPSFAVLAWMALWSVVFAGMNPVACILNAAGRLKEQAIFAGTSALANVGLSILWAPRYGISGVIAATVVSYALLAAIPIWAAAARLLARLEPAAANLA